MPREELCDVPRSERFRFFFVPLETGDYGGRGVYLTGSQLPSLDEGVFGPMLRSMHNASEGLLYLDSKSTPNGGVRKLLEATDSAIFDHRLCVSDG